MSTLYVDNLAPNLGSQVQIPNLKPLAGSVVQVVQHTDTTTYTNTTTSAAQGPQTSTFSLSNSANKVLITVNCCMRAQRNVASGARIGLWRGSVSSGTKITSGSEPQFYTTDSGTEQYAIVSMQFLDTPASSSPTYSIGFWKHTNAIQAQIMGGFLTTTMILQEIAQ